RQGDRAALVDRSGRVEGGGGVDVGHGDAKGRRAGGQILVGDADGDRVAAVVVVGVQLARKRAGRRDVEGGVAGRITPVDVDRPRAVGTWVTEGPQAEVD